MIVIKKFLIIALLCLLLCGCKDNNTSSSGVTVTMPKDDTVNGYRVNEPTLDNTPSSSESTISHNGLYYANTESRKFHLSGCDAAAKIFDENLYISEFRDELTEKGFKPCGICNP